MKNSHNNDNLGTLEQIFRDTPDKTKDASIFGSLLGFVLSCISGGVILAMLVAPALVPLSVTPQAVSAYWDTLPTELPEPQLAQHSYIKDSNGKKIAEFYSENRILIKLDDISPHTINALIATEDARFYTHDGVDWKGIGRALKSNALEDTNQGASTITQQLVKNTLLLAATNSAERFAAKENSYQRKLEEIRYAKALEEKYTKDEILERYLNVVLFSNGVYGIGTAAKYYFGVEAKDLTIPQSAMLIGLLKNPSSYNPINNPQNALGRRNVVIDRMVATGTITKEEGETYKQEPLGLNLTKTPNGCAASKYPFFCQWVVDSLIDDPRLGDNIADRQSALFLGGLTIQTTLDPAIQKKVQKVVDSSLGRDNRVAAGVAIVENGTGRVVAINQNRSWGKGTSKNGAKKTQIVLPAAPAYQPGSAFKPIGLAAALESGFPSNAIINAPNVFNPGDMNVPTGGIKNLSSIASGPLTINKATAVSSNTYYAELARRTGVLTVAEMAKLLGISVPDTVSSKDGSFILGTTETSPIEMAGAYAAFASQGIYCSPTGIDSITFPDGTVNSELNNCKRAISASTAGTVQKALMGVIDGPEEYRSGELASLGRQAGGKTGTTSSHAAAWFAGNTPQYSSAVWLGDPRGGFKYPLTQGFRYKGQYMSNVFASKIAAPLWKDVMNSFMTDLPKEKFNLSNAGGSVSTRVVPDTRGMEVSAAVSTLENLGFHVKINTKTAKEKEGLNKDQVYSQDPQGGYRIFDAQATTITLTLTHGSAMPKLSDK